MFIIGVDPHKGSHTATVLDATEEVIAEYRVDADAKQLERLLGWAQRFTPHRWALEGAGGTGALLARQLVAAGEHVVDVPATLTARVRLLEPGTQRQDWTQGANGWRVVAAHISTSEAARTVRRADGQRLNLTPMTPGPRRWWRCATPTSGP